MLSRVDTESNDSAGKKWVPSEVRVYTSFRKQPHSEIEDLLPLVLKECGGTAAVIWLRLRHSSQRWGRNWTGESIDDLVKWSGRSRVTVWRSLHKLRKHRWIGIADRRDGVSLIHVLDGDARLAEMRGGPVSKMQRDPFQKCNGSLVLKEPAKEQEPPVVPQGTKTTPLTRREEQRRMREEEKARTRAYVDKWYPEKGAN